MRRMSLVLGAGVWAAVLLAPHTALADDPAKPTVTVKSPATLRGVVDDQLSLLVKAPSHDARKKIIADLATRGQPIVEALTEFLARDHGASVDERRRVLSSIKASVPDSKGKFESPKRMKEDQIRADDDFDWLKALPTDPKTEAAREVIADVAALRVLALTKLPTAATSIINAGFDDSNMIYRDECGRRLRAMNPYSIPALMLAAKEERANNRVSERMRYATYQLERIDRQDPDKALIATAGDEALQVAVFDAFRQTHHREAVYAVFKHINVDAPRIRAAARATWLAYVVGPPPPLGAMRHMVLPGGRVAAKATPVELNYRLLAEQELRVALGDLFKEALDDDDDIDGEAASKRIFAYYDEQRTAQDVAKLAEGRRLAESGDLIGATAIFDRLLATDPDRDGRADLAPSYLALAAELEAKADWGAAAAAYSKANGLDPSGANAKHALARSHFALGNLLIAEGKDGAAEFRIAQTLEPTDEETREAVAATAPANAATPWFLYAGIGGGILALVLLIIGIRRRA